MSTEAEDDPIRVGRDVYVPDGTRLGTISKVYGPVGNSDETWVAVDAGISDGPYVVPCDGAGLFSEGLQVRHTIEEVQASPHVSAEDELTDTALAELSGYYDLTRRTSLNPGSPEADDSPSQQPHRGGQPATVDETTAAVDSGPADVGTDRSDAESESGDSPRAPGTVTVSGAGTDVDVNESDRLHASRADARAAAGYPDGATTDD